MEPIENQDDAAVALRNFGGQRVLGRGNKLRLSIAGDPPDVAPFKGQNRADLDSCGETGDKLSGDDRRYSEWGGPRK